MWATIYGIALLLLMLVGRLHQRLYMSMHAHGAAQFWLCVSMILILCKIMCACVLVCMYRMYMLSVCII